MLISLHAIEVTHDEAVSCESGFGTVGKSKIRRAELSAAAGRKRRSLWDRAGMAWCEQFVSGHQVMGKGKGQSRGHSSIGPKAFPVRARVGLSQPTSFSHIYIYTSQCPQKIYDPRPQLAPSPAVRLKKVWSLSTVAPLMKHCRSRSCSLFCGTHQDHLGCSQSPFI
jgi:hypothetical protein